MNIYSENKLIDFFRKESRSSGSSIAPSVLTQKEWNLIQELPDYMTRNSGEISPVLIARICDMKKDSLKLEKIITKMVTENRKPYEISLFADRWEMLEGRLKMIDQSIREQSVEYKDLHDLYENNKNIFREIACYLRHSVP